MNERNAAASKVFSETFHVSPEVSAEAPGRVEILGNHTDYNQGFVLSAAIDRYITIAVGKAENDCICEAVSTQFGSVVRIGETSPQKKNKWVNYPLGVWAMLREAGHPVGSFRVAVDGDIPMGAGLSSSAALETATALALCELFGISLDKAELARICQKAEHEFCGTQCGLLDQYSVLFGKKDHLLFTDFRNLTYRTIPLPRQDLVLAITPSGVTHSLSDSAYNDRRSQCFEVASYFEQQDPSVKTLRDVSSAMLELHADQIDPVSLKRARHVVTEDERVLKGVQLLESGEAHGFGHLLFASHRSSRIDFENSCSELDTLVELARGQDGVYGARLTGGGFGGATIALLEKRDAEAYASGIPSKYQAETGRSTRVHQAAIAEGARVF